MNKKTKNIPDKAFTHGGRFHADDVFSAALLSYLNPDIVIGRGTVVPDDYSGIVFDIGLGEYDHHQKDRKTRENGVIYAAFGLLWKEFGSEILGDVSASEFDENFVQMIDLTDNTGKKNEVSTIISEFNIAWDSEESQDEAFYEAKEFALTILKKKFETIKSIDRAKNYVKLNIEKAKNRILVLPKAVPWKEAVMGTDIEFVIFPSDRGGYIAQGVPSDVEANKLKIAFPRQWWGKTEDELLSITKLKILFCHNNGFLISVSTKEDAIGACKLAKQL